MEIIKRSKVLMVILLILTGCTRLETFLARENEGSEFDKQLVEYYKEFAQNEAEECDWGSSRKFINKGMALLNGEEIEPEKLKWRDIPKENLPELVEARNQLIEVLNDEDLLNAKPIAAAKAMYSFDCWVEEQAENWQEEEIKACKDNFYQSMKELKAAPAVVENQVANPSATKTSDESNKDKAELNIINESKRIYFAYDSFSLSKESIDKIEKLVAVIKKLDHEVTDIELSGYTDRAGPKWYNVQLSKKRAIEVKKYMEKLGISADKIKVFAYGFANPLIETSKKEPKNRRVEIVISDK
jgi:OOP family OmpA-OmpF porin